MIVASTEPPAGADGKHLYCFRLFFFVIASTEPPAGADGKPLPSALISIAPLLQRSHQPEPMENQSS